MTKHEQQFKKDGITWLHVPLQKHVLAFTMLGWWLLYDRRLAIDLFGEKMEEKKKKGEQTLINFLTALRVLAENGPHATNACAEFQF